MNRARPEFVFLSMAIGGLVFGVVSVILMILIEVYVEEVFVEPKTPYGAPASFAVLVSAILGLLVGRLFESMRSRNFSTGIIGYFVGVILVTGWFLYSVLAWISPGFDSSAIVIFGALAVSIAATYFALIFYLCLDEV